MHDLLNPPLLLADGGISILVMLALSVALSAASYFLAASAHGPRQRAIFTPTTLAMQGSWVPLLIGRRRIGCVLAWAGSRYTRHEPSGGSGGGLFGKGGKKKKSAGAIVYYEAGWHLLCVGPATTLYRIWQEGKIIWEGSINSTDDPSGSMFTANDASEFTIYWGEPDQPINTLLGDPSRVGWSSRWPHVCYVVWTNKRLGASPRWPQIEYDVECEAYTVRLDADYPGLTSAVDPYITAAEYAGVNAGYAMGQVLFESYPHGVNLPAEHFSIQGGGDPCSTDPSVVTGDVGDQTFDVSDFAGSTAAGTFTLSATDSFVVTQAGWYEVVGTPPYAGPTAELELDIIYPNTVVVSAAAATLTDGTTTYNMLAPGGSLVGVVAPGPIPSCWDFADSGTLLTLYRQYSERRYVYLDVGTWTFDFSVSVTGNTGGQFVGLNLAATLTEIESPVVTPVAGGGFSALCQLMLDEEQTASVVAADGAEADGVVGQLMQDMGTLLNRDHEDSGLNSWYPIREEAPLVLPSGVLLPTEVETEVLHIERGVDRASFTFADVDRAYKDTVLSIDEDGQASWTGNIRARKIDLPTVIDFAVADKVSERRSQEELAGGARFTVFAARDTRTLSPGRAIEHPDLPVVLRLTEIKLDCDSDRVELTLIQDHYGASVSTHEATAEPTSGGDTSTAADNFEYDFIEVPAFLGELNVMSVVPLRVRGNQRMSLQVIHVSPSGSSYVETNRDITVQAGGKLTEPMGLDGWGVEDGPTFDTEGDDLADVVEDYSADPTTWGVGRQMLMIGEELFFLRNVEALGGVSYRLHGLKRARYDTERAEHAVDDPIFIFTFDAADPIFDVLLAPGATLYMKQQAVGGGPGAVDLTSVPATSKTLVGKGVVPMRPGGLRMIAPHLGVFAYATGEDVTFRWSYRSVVTPNTGAGLQGAGLATGGSAVQGSFEVRLLDTGDVLKQTIVQTTTEYTLTNADLLTWFGSEQDFKIEVRNINGGFRSAAITRTVELV